MNIKEIFIKNGNIDLDIRITCGHRWMVINDTTNELVVYERKPYQKNTNVIGQTKNEDLAYTFLTTDI